MRKRTGSPNALNKRACSTISRACSRSALTSGAYCGTAGRNAAGSTNIIAMNQLILPPCEFAGDIEQLFRIDKCWRFCNNKQCQTDLLTGWPPGERTSWSDASPQVAQGSRT